jgi:RNA polymerase sigma-70 factor, ECF subfamily
MATGAGEQVWEAAAVCSAPEDREEALCLERARAGDELAYRWLLARYRQRAVRLAAHVLRRPGEAEDVAQEAFIRAFSRLRDFRGEGCFFSWLARIVVRLCLDRRRCARWHTELSSDTCPAGKWFVSGAETGEVDLRLVVERLLDSLSPPMRAALVLRELEGLEYEEIAQALRIPVGTVRSRLNAARAQFRRRWEEALQEETHG